MYNLTEKGKFLVTISDGDLGFYIYDIESRWGDNALRVAQDDSGRTYASVTERRSDYADETLAWFSVDVLRAELHYRLNKPL
jgi:hypothetical protein